jgi:hypothetical protein
VRDEYARSYASNEDGSDDVEDVDSETQSDPSKQSAKTTTNIFDNLPALTPPKPATLGCELDRYLASDVEYVADPISWWHNHCDIYPHLSRMALDYLSIPGTFK